MYGHQVLEPINSVRGVKLTINSTKTKWMVM